MNNDFLQQKVIENQRIEQEMMQTMLTHNASFNMDITSAELIML